MKQTAKKLLYDIDQALYLLLDFTREQDLGTYAQDVVSNEIVWDVVQNRLPILKQEIDMLRASLEMS